MRSITDAEGQAWDVEIGRESYGMQVLLFSPQRGGGVRKALMSASTRLEATDELAQASEAHLRGRLEDSVPWESENLR